jgi:hypothetical protein
MRRKISSAIYTSGCRQLLYLLDALFGRRGSDSSDELDHRNYRVPGRDDTGFDTDYELQNFEVSFQVILASWSDGEGDARVLAGLLFDACCRVGRSQS